MEIGQNYKARNRPHDVHWKLTKIFIHEDGEQICRLEKYQGGRNSPALLTKKKLNKNFIKDERKN